MARAWKFLFPLLMLLALASGCSPDAPARAPTLNPTAAVYQSWYDEAVAGFGRDAIAESAAGAGAAAEYRVLRDVPLLRSDFYSLQVFADGTGRFAHLAQTPKYFNGSHLLSDDNVNLNAEQTQVLLDALAQADFWTIPAAQGGGEGGSGGETIYIEGFAGGKTHFTRTWSPNGDFNSVYQSVQIYHTFAAAADALWGKEK